jgi:hypothetical protein
MNLELNNNVFKIGDKVTYTNDNGCIFPGQRKIIMSKKKYVVEPRTKEGKLDVKRLTEIPFPIEGITEEKLFDYYFRHQEGEKKYSEHGL